jgi:biotin operon repressor
MTTNPSKEALNTLRQQRKAGVDLARTMIKEYNRQIAAIKSQLQSGPQTVPEMAAALEMDSAAVLVTIATLRKYGEVAEDAKDGDYFKYRLASQAAA